MARNEIRAIEQEHGIPGPVVTAFRHPVLSVRLAIWSHGPEWVVRRLRNREYRRIAALPADNPERARCDAIVARAMRELSS